MDMYLLNAADELRVVVLQSRPLLCHFGGGKKSAIHTADAGASAGLLVKIGSAPSKRNPFGRRHGKPRC